MDAYSPHPDITEDLLCARHCAVGIQEQTRQTEIPALLGLHYTQTHKSTGCVPLIGPL